MQSTCQRRIDPSAEKKLALLVQRVGEAQAERDRTAEQLESYIKDLKLTLQSRDQALDDAREAARARGRFIANVSHEFRTPLTTILGFSRLMRCRPSPVDPSLAVPQITAATEQLLDLVDNLIAYADTGTAKATTADETRCDVAALCQRAMDRFERVSSEKNLRLRLECVGDPLPVFHTDSSRLYRALLLILGNAIKFSSEGEVRIEYSYKRGESLPIQIEIIDKGVGIPAHRIHAVLEPLIQSDLDDDRGFSGIGLGLPLARSILASIAGELDLASELEQGTQVRLRLPLALTQPDSRRRNDERAEIVWMQPQLERLTRDLHHVISEREQVKGEINQMRIEGLMRLASAAELKDGDTGIHIMRMGHYSQLIAESLGCDRDYCDLLLHASRMHDVGKIAVPDSILKKPGPLTPEEWEVMRRHPEIGASLLSSEADPLYQLSAEVALAHHEKWDGSGYPNGLRGERIPLSGRIVALADYFDALTMDRCYRKAFSDQDALRMVQENSGTHFDPDVVAAFGRALPQLIDARTQINRDLKTQSA